MQPENIVFVNSSSDSPVKIIDWGFAKRQQDISTLDTPLFTDKSVGCCLTCVLQQRVCSLLDAMVDQIDEPLS
jgi:hypothetical protein